MKVLMVVALFISGLLASAAAAGIPDFTVRESGLASENVELVALDENQDIYSGLKGTYSFSINGFETNMRFKKGVATFARKITSSSFLYIKHETGTGTVSRLFYVYRSLTGGYTVISIPLALLVIIPLGLILLGVFFRRLIIIILLLLGAFFYFSHVKGLSFDSFIDGAREWIMGLF